MDTVYLIYVARDGRLELFNFTKGFTKYSEACAFVDSLSSSWSSWSVEPATVLIVSCPVLKAVEVKSVQTT